MKGKEFNDLMKTIGAIKPIIADKVKMSGTLHIVDAGHVALMIVRAIDGSPVFGVESEDALNLKAVVKLPEKEVFNGGICENFYELSNDMSCYLFEKVDGSDCDKVKALPMLDNHHAVEVPAKMLSEAVKAMKGIRDYVTMEGSHGLLTMTAGNLTTRVSKILGETSGIFKVMLPFDYVERVAKVAKNMVLMEYDTDYPARWTWNDGCYEYSVMIAPRIDAE